MTSLTQIAQAIAQFASYTVTATGKPGVEVDQKKQLIYVGPGETMALAQVGISLPVRAELANAALQKASVAMTPAPQPQLPVRAPVAGRRWLWIGGGVLGGALITFLIMRGAGAEAEYAE